MSVKGYVVKGVGRSSERTLWAMRESLGLADTREEAATFDGVDEAIAAMAQLHACRDVRVFAVAEDGSETPVPTYEEALEQARAIDAIDAAVSEAGIGPRGLQDTLIARVGRLIADANAESDRLRAAEARIEELEAQLALAQRPDPLIEGIARSELGRE